MTADTQEMINRCLACDKPECTNCIEGHKSTAEYKYGKNVSEVAKSLGAPKTTFYSWVKIGGIEYAKAKWMKKQGGTK